MDDMNTSQPSGAAPLPPRQPLPAELAPPHSAPSRGFRAGRWILLLFLLAAGGFMFIVLIGLVGVASMASAPDDLVKEESYEYAALSETGADKIVILSVEGAIVGTEFFKQQIDKVRDDKSVKALVLRVDSPGGTVSASDYIYHHLRELREERDLPLVVSMGSMAASGGYYVAMAVGDQQDTIFAEPTTWTGSIGVIMPNYNVSKLMERFEIEDVSIASSSSPFKQIGSPTRPMSDEDRAVLQRLIDDCYARFKEVVLSGRPNYRGNDEQLAAVANGQIFTAGQALERGLIDREGFLEDAIDRAIELAGLDPKKTKAVRYKETPSLLSLFAASQVQPPRSELAPFLEMMKPQAWYLCSWLPAALSAQ